MAGPDEEVKDPSPQKQRRWAEPRRLRSKASGARKRKSRRLAERRPPKIKIEENKVAAFRRVKAGWSDVAGVVVVDVDKRFLEKISLRFDAFSNGEVCLGSFP